MSLAEKSHEDPVVGGLYGDDEEVDRAVVKASQDWLNMYENPDAEIARCACNDPYSARDFHEEIAAHTSNGWHRYKTWVFFANEKGIPLQQVLDEFAGHVINLST